MRQPLRGSAFAIRGPRMAAAFGDCVEKGLLQVLLFLPYCRLFC